MISANDIRQKISSLSEEEKNYLNLLAEIVEARKDNEMTQRELAEKSGLKQPAIARLESPNGQKAPNLLTVIKYLDGLGMKLKVVSK